MYKIDKWLYRGRYVAVFSVLAFILYCAVFVWLVTPFSDFGFYWRPEHQLVIKEAPAASMAALSLQTGDLVLEIDGREVHRSAPVFNGRARETYAYTVVREGEPVTVSVTYPEALTEIGLSYRLPSGILILGFWLVGFIMVRFAREEGVVAVRVAYAFIIIAAAITGVQAEVLSVTGAWLSRPLWYLAVVGILYLGFMPRMQPLALMTRRVFAGLIIMALALGLLALWEALALFPQHTSVDQWLGLGLYELLLLSGGLAWLLSFIILIIRVRRMPAPSYARSQLMILLVFIGLAIMPVTLLTLLPRALFDLVFLPFPLAIMLFVLVPAGYLFVIFRRGYLGLDIVFSKTAIFLLLALLTLVVYGSTLAFIRVRFPASAASILPETLIFLPVLFLALFMSKPVDRLVRHLFFGDVARNQSLPYFASDLSLKPELATLESIVARLAQDFQVAQAMLVLQEDNGRLAAIAAIKTLPDLPPGLDSNYGFAQPLLRSSAKGDAQHALFALYPWAELLLPITVRERQTGYLAFSRPQDGYFNAEQVLFLSRAADMIAVGSEAIFLFNASRRLSVEVVKTQEKERKALASDIHDEPLQQIAFVAQILRQAAQTDSGCSSATKERLQQQVGVLDRTMTQLRDICAGLFPSILTYGLEPTVADVVDRFERQFNLVVNQDVQVLESLPENQSVEVATAVYRVLTEALNNVVKHAHINEADVKLWVENHSLRLTVVDHGVGLGDTGVSVPDLVRSHHLGLVGMFEYADLVGGQLTLANRQPRGTAVTLTIPLETKHE